MDYKSLEIKGKRFNKLYVSDGNRLNFYKTLNEGVISIDNSDRVVRILLKDEFGNTSNARFRLKKTPLSEEMILSSRRPVSIEADLFENVLMVTSKTCSTNMLTAYYNGKSTEMNYTYKGSNERVYLINLQKSQPDSVKTCWGSLVFYFKDVVPSESAYTYYSDCADIRFPENSLYDTLFLSVNHKIENKTDIFVIGQRTVPLDKHVLLTLKPTIPIAANRNLSVYRLE